MIVRTGTSGFSYAAWKGPFYPAKCPSVKMLSFYGERLRTVEINNTFYKLPTAEIFAQWGARVPADFRFSLKASRFITYSLKLVNAKESLDRFYGVADELGEKVGPLLVQLPPFFSMELSALEDFVSVLPRGKRVALELRHPSWRNELVYKAMRKKNVAWVGVETDDESAFVPDTADWSYLRLRKEVYSEDNLKTWAKRLRGDGRDVFVYFKHEDHGVGPNLALRLAAACA